MQTAAERDRSALHRGLATLTPREREVLTLLAVGLSNLELAPVACETGPRVTFACRPPS